jgi:Leucine-rich repeat (LRR) protein
MSRLDWLVTLRELTGEEIRRRDLLAELHHAKGGLRLESPHTFAAKTDSIGLNFGEVVTAIEQLPHEMLAWDALIDGIVAVRPKRSLSHSKLNENGSKAKQIPGSHKEPLNCSADLSGILAIEHLSPIQECSYDHAKQPNSPVQLKSSKKSASQRQGDQTTCDLSFRVSRPLGLSEGLLHLSLAGTELTAVDISLPKTLQVLNLSSNKLTKVDLVLPSLRLLNLSQNQLQKVNGLQKCLQLTELWVSHNQVAAVSSLCRLSHLRLLDLSYNKIASLEDIATLTISNKLEVVCFLGNQLTTKPHYRAKVRTLMYKIATIDPPDLRRHSEFTSLGTLPYLKEELKPKRLTRIPLSSRNRSPEVLMRYGRPLEVKNSPKICRTSVHSPVQSRPNSARSENLNLSNRSINLKYPRDARTDFSTAVSAATTDRADDLRRPLAPIAYPKASTMQKSKSTFDFMDELERRLSRHEGGDTSAVGPSLNESVMITQEAIKLSGSMKYNNPISALMIKPAEGKRSSSVKSQRGSPSPCATTSSAKRGSARTVQFSLKRF